jgi:hypothetical protein
MLTANKRHPLWGAAFVLCRDGHPNRPPVDTSKPATQGEPMFIRPNAPTGALTVMSNVLDEIRKQQVIELGQLGWSLRRIEAATGLRCGTISGCLKKVTGIAVCRRVGRLAEWSPKTRELSNDPVSTAAAVAAAEQPERAPTANDCRPPRELINEAIRHDQNEMAIWQDLVGQHVVVTEHPKPATAEHLKTGHGT